MPFAPLEAGFFRFVVIFSWDHTEDTKGALRLIQLHKDLAKYGIIQDHGLYLIGKRTFVLMGATNSAANLQKFCATVCFGSKISAEVSHAVDAHELAGIAASMIRKPQKAK